MGGKEPHFSFAGLKSAVLRAKDSGKHSAADIAASFQQAAIDCLIDRLERDAHRPVLRPAGHCLPMVPSGGVIEILFRAGYGAAWSDLPPDLGQAVLLLAAHFYEHRSETALAEGCMPFGVASLIERYRKVRLFGGSGR